MNTENRWNARRHVAGTICILLLVAIVLTGGTPAGAAERRNVWQKLDQFVAIEKQDSSQTSPASPNDHPAQLSAEVVRATLGSLLVTSGDKEKPEALFTDGELATLGDALSLGLGQARPDEDISFAIIGFHQAVLGLFKQPMVTTGRLFVSKGQLNLILGMVHEPVSERDDRRLKPFVPGSRVKAASISYRVSSKGGELIQAATGRPDWLTLAPAAPAPARAEESTAPPAPGINTRPAPAPPAAGSTPSPRNMEERLLILKGLHDKGLITDEEYRAKRLEILREL